MSSTLPFVLYVVFIASWFLHLPARFEFLAPLRIDLMLVCVIAAYCWKTERTEPLSPHDQRTRVLVAGIAVYALVSCPFVEWPGSVLKNGLPQFVKAAVFYYFTATLIGSTKRLKILLVVFVACETFRVLEPVYLHLTEGYWGSRASMADWESMDRLSGSPFDTVNPNGLAGIVLTVVPFLHYLTLRSKGGRLVYVLTLPLLLYALALTGSRSGMIGLASILTLVWVKSRHKLVLAATIAVVVACAIPYLTDDLTDRYLSIFSSKTKNSQTASERSQFMEADLRVALRRPIFGYGLGTSAEANGRYEGDERPAHNLYVEVLEELGAVGLLVFLAFMVSLCRGLLDAASVVRQTEGAPSIVVSLMAAVYVWTGMNLIFSFASYGLCSYEWYFAAGLIEVARRLRHEPSAAAAVASARPVKMTQFRPRQSLRPAPVEYR
jgi:putative inorganic carbon (hco3(-)) transporter